MYAPEVEAQEKKHERISALLTLLFTVVFFLISLLFTVYRDRVPPPGVKDYQVLGSIDFGNYRQGSRNVNTFEEPVPNPSETTPRSTPPAQEAQVSDNTPDPAPPIVTPAPSPVTQPDPPPTPRPDPKPSPPQTTQPDPKPQPTPQPNPQPSPNTQPSLDDDLLYDPSDNGGGSNQGNSDNDVGNSGTPDVKVLDPNGLYSFGTGEGGGLEGRNPIRLDPPTYNVQEEGTLQFEFIINPDGSVAFAKVLGVTNKPGLRDAGIAAIKKWRFSALPPGAPQRPQKVQVTIRFKLK